MTPVQRSRFIFPTQLLLAGAGLGISLELVGHHISSTYGKGGDSGLCTALQIFSCDAAAKSDFSQIAGLPIAVIGAAFYAALLLLLPLGRFGPAKGFGHTRDVVLASGVGAVLYSVFLLCVSLITLGKLCPLCMGLYLVNTGLFLTAWLSHPEGRAASLKGLLRLPKHFETWLAVLLVAGGTYGFQALYAQQAKAARAASRALLPGNAPPVQLDLDEATARGPADAALTIVEFSDFQCPFCRRLAEALDEAAKAHGNVRIVFRHYPMDSACNPAVQGKFHDLACGAARASVCAEQQGKFWEMHDHLFAQQTDLAEPRLAEHAATLGLDAAKFSACMAAPETLARLQRDVARGEALKIRGTPSWYINGLAYVGARNVEELLAIFERTAPGTGKTPAPGAPGSDSKAAHDHP